MPCPADSVHWEINHLRKSKGEKNTRISYVVLTFVSINLRCRCRRCCWCRELESFDLENSVDRGRLVKSEEFYVRSSSLCRFCFCARQFCGRLLLFFCFCFEKNSISGADFFFISCMWEWDLKVIKFFFVLFCFGREIKNPLKGAMFSEFFKWDVEDMCSLGKKRIINL